VTGALGATGHPADSGCAAPIGSMKGKVSVTGDIFSTVH